MEELENNTTVEIKDEKAIVTSTVVTAYDAEEYLRMCAGLDRTKENLQESMDRVAREEKLMLAAKQEMQNIRDRQIDAMKQERAAALAKEQEHGDPHTN